MLTVLVIVMIALVAYWAMNGGLDEIGVAADQAAVSGQPAS